LYARVSTNDRRTPAIGNRALREYVARRGWTVAWQVREVKSGVLRREAHEKLLEAARQWEIDVVLVWRLDRWGRFGKRICRRPLRNWSIGVSGSGKILRERTRAGLAHARKNGKRLGRPATAVIHAAEIRKLQKAR